jgi:phenylpropionate dioxygenase-like ring-hydroxylating dioxygenase large terminal subunit
MDTHEDVSPAGGLLHAYRSGFSLPQGFYTREDVFAIDRDLLLNRWIYAAHESELTRPGDFVLAELGADSAIIIRGPDGIIRARANVCRHRGSRICTTPRGHAGMLVCPYHAWSYNLDGSLRAAREMPDGFDPASYNLVALPTSTVGGLIFVSFGDDPPDITDARHALKRMTDAYGWQDAKIAAARSYRVAANWKLAMENYHECYHCGPAHPEFSEAHVLARAGARRIGGQDAESWPAASDGREVFRVMHSQLADQADTGSRDGKPVAPLMGGATYDKGCVFSELGLLSAFLAYPDHGVIYRFRPKTVLETEMDVIWLVRGDAEEGRDYDPEKLTWLWDVTSTADKTIIERNQAGVRSRAYRPGPFSKMEPGTRQYVDRYIAEFAAIARAHG